MEGNWTVLFLKMGGRFERGVKEADDFKQHFDSVVGQQTVVYFYKRNFIYWFMTFVCNHII